ncbi:MAG: hypothetical protein M3M88_05430 [Thermoproteota archaeon]|nr:hypothetical protein [Thermoproteota archaeon]
MDKDNKNKINYKSIVQQYVVKNSRKRKIVNNLITVLLFSFVVIAIIPLVSILVDVFRNGAAAFSLDFLILPPVQWAPVMGASGLPFRALL